MLKYLTHELDKDDRDSIATNLTIFPLTHLHYISTSILNCYMLLSMASKPVVYGGKKV